MEINRANKAKFFAQYYGQKVLFDGIEEVVLLDGYHIHQVEENPRCGYKLMLTPLEELSEKDALTCAKLWGTEIPSKIIGRSIVLMLFSEDYQVPTEFRNISRVLDFLRSKGYLMPWMGMTSEDLIEAGWVVQNSKNF